MREQRQRVLVLSPGAGAVTDEVRRRLDAEFPDARLVPFPDGAAALDELDRPAVVIVCGGDGTVGAVARRLAGTGHVLGIVPLGTFNNFARSLGIPAGLEDALATVRDGVPRDCTLGRAGGTTFLEAAMAGRLGSAIELGEAAKDGHFGDVRALLEQGRGRARFRYRITGDVALAGQASSIVVANTASTGALLSIGEGSPTDPTLELRIVAGTTLRGRLAALIRAVLRRPPPGRAHRVRRVRITTEPAVPVVADAASAGDTPLDVEAVPGALRVLLPAGPETPPE